MKKLTLILLLAISPALYAQIEAQKDTVRLMKEPLKFDEKLDHYLKPDYLPTIDKSASLIMEPLKVKNKESIDLKLPIPNVYFGPPVENNTFTRYPFANDYSFMSGMTISNKAWLTSSSSQYGYPTLGAVRSVGMNLNYMPTNWLTVGVGPYGAKYHLYGKNYNDVGINGSLKFKLTDRISVNGYGQYSVFADQNRVYGPLVNMYPSTYYGGDIEFRITEKFGVKTGVTRELNPFTGKWVNIPYVAPVFYNK